METICCHAFLDTQEKCSVKLSIFNKNERQEIVSQQPMYQANSV